MKHKLETKPPRRRGVGGRISISWKLFAYLALFTLFILGVVWTMQIGLLNYFYSQSKYDELELTDRLLTDTLQDNPTRLDEVVEDCALRELKEEMGLDALELIFFCVNSGPEAHHVYPNGDEVSNFEIVYLCRKYQGKPHNTDGEMTELRFFASEEIDLDMISKPIRPVLRQYMERYA